MSRAVTLDAYFESSKTFFQYCTSGVDGGSAQDILLYSVLVGAEYLFTEINFKCGVTSTCGMKVSEVAQAMIDAGVIPSIEKVRAIISITNLR